ncbi:DUF4268 domain-containing protein [Sphingobacterium sp. lm-10]|uniref:DUF4268 domain-containing protein n=1 Tax=Sphingobacterium sp. lm-10 TaxID=2944904 RepID=UPI002021F744|nr:DUF4268 domain-containing protein [Sphingobacterium sp. lm-10]MCL7986907.1 DUF4268 domain-containing protein [Sphingobacterium sp. lm-10]
MYGRDEVKKIKEAFWTAYGQYMRVVPFADAEKQSWINYKTGVKHLFFRMEADNKVARIAIEIDHPDAGMRALMYAQFEQYRGLLEGELEEAWDWLPKAQDPYGKEFSCIQTTIQANIMEKEDWPKLISFFKPRIIGLDSFWSSAKYAFELFT